MTYDLKAGVPYRYNIDIDYYDNKYRGWRSIKIEGCRSFKEVTNFMRMLSATIKESCTEPNYWSYSESKFYHKDWENNEEYNLRWFKLCGEPKRFSQESLDSLRSRQAGALCNNPNDMNEWSANMAYNG